MLQTQYFHKVGNDIENINNIVHATEKANKSEKQK